MTLAHYRKRSKAFWQGTKDHDVSQNIQALLAALDQAFNLASYRILDFGCGPGRDLKVFTDLGHQPIGLDGCREFTEHATKYANSPVWTQNFFALDLPKNDFHGVFANASFFQIPSKEMPSVLKQLEQSLKDNGILFMSNPRGHGEGFYGDRYATYLELDDYTQLLEKTGFNLLHHYYRPPGLPQSEQPWLAMIAKKL